MISGDSQPKILFSAAKVHKKKKKNKGMEANFSLLMFHIEFAHVRHSLSKLSSVLT